MTNFTEKEINSYADKLLIGLTKEETKMIMKEFKDIEKNMNLINEIPNIKDVEPLSYPFEMVLDDLRCDDVEGDKIDIDKLLQNCDRYDGREVEVPKVVG